jgi:hypothetical protein
MSVTESADTQLDDGHNELSSKVSKKKICSMEPYQVLLLM